VLETTSTRLEKEQAAMRARHTPRVFLTQSAAASTEPAHTTRFLSIAQIAEELNISHDSALRLFRDHPEAVCMSPDMANRKRLSLRVPRTVVEEFINSRKRGNCRSFPDREENRGD
jgi:hypothetical protein